MTNDGKAAVTVRKYLFWALASVVFACGCATTVAPATVSTANAEGWRRVEKGGVVLWYKAPDKSGAEQLASMAAAAKKQVESFFGRPFPSPFEVLVFPDRQRLTDHWRHLWSEPGFQAQCWMVAEGSAKAMTLLSPGVWSTQACEHDASNSARTLALITHELTHVFHAQQLPTRSFDGMEDIEWFAEGLAT